MDRLAKDWRRYLKPGIAATTIQCSSRILTPIVLDLLSAPIAADIQSKNNPSVRIAEIRVAPGATLSSTRLEGATTLAAPA